MKINDIHLIAAFFQDISAVVVLCHITDVKHLASLLVIEQLHLVEEVDARHHLIHLHLGVGGCQASYYVVEFLNRHWHFDAHTCEGVEHLVDKLLVGFVLVVNHPAAGMAIQLYLMIALVGEEESRDGGCVVNGEVGRLAAQRAEIAVVTDKDASDYYQNRDYYY